MGSKDYSKYTVADFLEDQSFILFVKKGENATYWNNELERYSKSNKAMELALIELRLIYSDQRDFENPHAEDLWCRIEESVTGYTRRLRRIRVFNLLRGVAAACLFFVLYGMWFFKSTITVRTGNGEVKAVELPDGSKVTLNANSSISYHRAMNWMIKRTVDFEGEAYFEVKHFNKDVKSIARGDLFQVHNAKMDVAVLGTKFNFKARPYEYNVLLFEGRVKVFSHQDRKEAILRPGERLVLNTRYEVQAVKKVSSLNETLAWMEGKLSVDQETVAAIIKEFESIYGYRIVLPDTSYGNRKIDGAISLSSEENFLFVLKNILDADVRKEGKVIYFEKR